uniref:NOT2/NOT3/NOT5 C-terminal domain-containing protein n=1 Tax=Oryza rufipogon TaxID=4529 RepID=A0A0E0PP65_ORYRU
MFYRSQIILLVYRVVFDAVCFMNSCSAADASVCDLIQAGELNLRRTWICISSSSGARSNLPVSTGKALTPTFSGQSGSVSGFRHPGSLAPRGSSMTGSSSLGVQPPRGSISGAWFPPNSLQASIYQVGYPALSNRGAAPVCGNFGPRITYVASVAGGGNIGRTISSAGMSMPTVASPVNLSGSGALNIRGSNQMGGTHQQGLPAMNMLGSSSSAPGGTLSKNQLQAGSSSSGSPGMRHDGPLRQQAFGINAVQQNQEFRIHNEDFPALPRLEGMELHRKDHLPKNANIMQAQHYPMGKSSGFNTGSSCPPRKQHKQTANSVQNTGPENVGPRPVNSPRSPLNPRPREQVIQQNHEPQAQKSVRLQSSSGPESHKVQSPKSSQRTDTTLESHKVQSPKPSQRTDTAPESHKVQSPKSSQRTDTAPDPYDPYGLHGLLRVMKLKEEGPASLALGIDLTTLGLDMNSSDNLYKTFGSPWSSEPVKEEYSYEIPDCYSSMQPPPLQALHFLRFHLMTLFYIFYSMPQDAAQLYAANEICKYGWVYHKELRQWVKRAPNTTPLVKTTTYEQGLCYLFDANIWDAIPKDNFILRYDDIEKIPALPPLLPATQNPATQNGSVRINKWYESSARAWTPSAAASSIGQALVVVDGLTLYARLGAGAGDDLLSGLVFGAADEALLRIKMNTIMSCRPPLDQGDHLLLQAARRGCLGHTRGFFCTDTIFSFDGNTFWADLSQGFMCCDTAIVFTGDGGGSPPPVDLRYYLLLDTFKSEKLGCMEMHHTIGILDNFIKLVSINTVRIAVAAATTKEEEDMPSSPCHAATEAANATVAMWTLDKSAGET